MRVIDRAQGMREGVHRAEAGLEGGGAHGGGDQHIGPGLDIGPVIAGRL